MIQFRLKNGQLEKLIFCPYIVVKGKIVYPKKAKYFRFWVKVTEKAA